MVLCPGESETMTVTYNSADLQGATPVISISGSERGQGRHRRTRFRSRAPPPAISYRTDPSSCDTVTWNERPVGHA